MSTLPYHGTEGSRRGPCRKGSICWQGKYLWVLDPQMVAKTVSQAVSRLSMQHQVHVGARVAALLHWRLHGVATSPA